MIRTEDLTGKRFGHYEVLKRLPDHTFPNGVSTAKWLCKCDCGNVRAVIGQNLRNGNSTSCGCVRRRKNNLRLRKKYAKFIVTIDERQDIMDLWREW